MIGWSTPPVFCSEGQKFFVLGTKPSNTDPTKVDKSLRSKTEKQAHGLTGFPDERELTYRKADIVAMPLDRDLSEAKKARC